MVKSIYIHGWIYKISSCVRALCATTMNLSGPRMPWQIGLSQADFVTTQPKIIHVLLWLWQHEVLIKCRPIHDNNKVEVGVRMQYYINELVHSNTLTARKYIVVYNFHDRWLCCATQGGSSHMKRARDFIFVLNFWIH